MMAKFSKDSKSSEQRVKDRKRNLIILIEQYLMDNGYVESVTKLEQESTISLDNYGVCDNVDLYMILTDYEAFHEYKFGKPAK